MIYRVLVALVGIPCSSLALLTECQIIGRSGWSLAELASQHWWLEQLMLTLLKLTMFMRTREAA